MSKRLYWDQKDPYRRFLCRTHGQEDGMTIDDMLRIKEETGYSYAALEKLSGIPAATIQKILTGKSEKPRVRNVKELQKVFAAISEKSRADNRSYQECSEGTGYGEIREARPAYSAVRTQGHFTIEDYCALPDDVRMELIDGYLIKMEAPSCPHQYLVGEAFHQIADYIHKNKGRCRPLSSPIDVQLDRDDRTMLQPDVLIVCDPSKVRRRVVYGAPDFVLEVISESTRKKDFIKKTQKYADAGVREYWIVDPFQEKVFVYFFEEANILRLYGLYDDIPVQIYGGELVISFRSVREWIEEVPEEDENF